MGVDELEHFAPIRLSPGHYTNKVEKRTLLYDLNRGWKEPITFLVLQLNFDMMVNPITVQGIFLRQTNNSSIGGTYCRDIKYNDMNVADKQYCYHIIDIWSLFHECSVSAQRHHSGFTVVPTRMRRRLRRLDVAT